MLFDILDVGIIYVVKTSSGSCMVSRRSFLIIAEVSSLSIWHFLPVCAIIWKSIIFPACLILTQQQLYLFFYYIQENLNAFNSLINSREIGRCSLWEDGLCSLFAFHFEKEAVLMTNANTSDALPVNRTFKSTLFIMLFEDKKNLLELYNAITGKHYADPELLEINTLENAIYMSMKNDVSFLIDGRLSLYEHQSTKNPNLPLRFLLYISHLYSRLTVKENLYGETIVQIPAPEFLIFYNGKDKMPERQILKLSDMYSVQEGQPKLELEATLLNISGSNNQKLKEACRTLGEYAIYTDKIRNYTETMELSEAVDRAMDECIREDVLREFLMKHRAEARAMSIFEYDQERHMQQEREAGIEKGKEQLLRRQVQKNLSRGMSISEIAEVLDETEERIREIASEDPGEQAE